EEGRMIAGRKVPDEEDIVGPGKFRRILCAGDDKAGVGPPTRRRDEKTLNALLPIGGISPKIGQVAGEFGPRRRRTMHRRVDMAKERSCPLGTEPIAKFLERPATGIGENEVEIGEPA